MSSIMDLAIAKDIVPLCLLILESGQNSQEKSQIFVSSM
ncbi:MAG: hypothetical protein JETT_2008 [Candidatus Jettenia ecosi]|uniref:Uncharacterized protein n=1 Tax=Candidatus Jettenia ecosi TaxID=2494326 RepID=A0A533QAJ9_9BACT|nr:MAG: hypothetical protein JETT_2008 [Candidatus Jettenia ecosi]